MENSPVEFADILEAARRRGEAVTEYAPLPAGLDKFTTYAGLISSALELGKLVATEERDLQAIASHYDIEVRRISAAFREVEMAMLAGFEQDASLRERTFDAINLLIEKGQFEIASEFHRRLIDSFSRPPLETLVELRNQAGSGSGTRLRVL